MAPSQEVRDALGEGATAAELLAAKQIELTDAETALDAAELRMDVRETVRLQDEVAVLARFIMHLEAKVAIERASEAREEAVTLDADLRKQYCARLDALLPDIEAARQAIKAMSTSVRRCGRTWHEAMRARLELDLLRLRFGLEGADLATLPASPLDAVQAAFWESIDKHDALCRRDPLPVVIEIASDSPEQLAVKRMVAAADHVAAYGESMKFSVELRDLFAKAGVLPALPSRPQEPLFEGQASLLPLPPGAMATALAPSHLPSMPETPHEQQIREQEQRVVARQRADRSRELVQAAELLRKGLPGAE